MKSSSEYDLRKAQLVAQCDLERLRLRFTMAQIRDTLTAPASTQPTVWAAPVAATLLSFTLPSLGTQRVRRIVRVLSLALSGYRLLTRLRALTAKTASAPAGAPTK